MSILFFVLAACTTPCTDLEAASVSVTLTNRDGEKVSDGTVTFTVDGAATQDCESYTDGEYICGWEQSGHIVVTAIADGYGDVTGEVDVAADECHVTAEHIDLQLDSRDCAAVEPVGVNLTVIGVDDEVLANAWANYSVDGGAAQDCVAVSAEAFQCGTVTGEYVLTAGADGHKAGTTAASVVIDSTECHPDTLDAQITLEWGQD